MLEAHRISSLRARWEVREDGAPLMVLEKKGWRSSVRYTLDGVDYEVQSTWTGTQYTLVDAEGTECARAHRIGRKAWSISTSDGELHFRRRSIWKADQEWLSGPDGEARGSIRRTGTWRGDAEADLPGMPTPLAVFTLAVVLLMWEQASAAAASGAAVT